MDLDFQERSDAFMKWLLEVIAAKVSPKIELADLRDRGAGRGLVALDDIEEDEELFAIPRSGVISVQTSELKKKIPRLLEDLDPWLGLILVLIYELLRGSSSKWKPYLDILPQQYDSLMFWSKDELADLQGSSVVQKIGKEEADAIFKGQIVAIILSRPDLFSQSKIQEIVEIKAIGPAIIMLAHIMGSAVMAYAFDIEINEDEHVEDDEGFISEEEEALLKGMIPLADILNADADRNNARLFYHKSSLTMKALRPVRRGEELFNDYGPLPRSDLLRRYGYITDNYAQYDVVEVKLKSIRETAAEMKTLAPEDVDSRLVLLSNQGLLEEGYDISRLAASSSTFSPNLLVVLNALTLPADAFKKVMSSNPLATSQMTSEVAELLQNVLLRRRADYSTGIDEDKMILQDSSVIGRKRSAVKVRLGEKEILWQALVETAKLVAGPCWDTAGSALKRPRLEDMHGRTKKSRLKP